jgi:hypothetical protein
VTARDHSRDAVLNGLSLTRAATPPHDIGTHAILNALTFLVLRTPADPVTGAPAATAEDHS